MRPVFRARRLDPEASPETGPEAVPEASSETGPEAVPEAYLRNMSD